MEINNPYLKELRELTKETDKNKDPEKLKRLEELQKLNRNFIQQKIEELSSNLEKTYKATNEIEEKLAEENNKKKDKKDKKTKYSLYKQSIELYRKCRDLLKEAQNVKTFARDYLYAELGYDVDKKDKKKKKVKKK